MSSENLQAQALLLRLDLGGLRSWLHLPSPVRAALAPQRRFSGGFAAGHVCLHSGALHAARSMTLWILGYLKIIKDYLKII